jgi:hypothetical protein
MSPLTPSLQAFFTERLITQRNASPHTIAAYRDTFRLLLHFAQQQTGKQPFQLDIDDLDAPLIGAFLTHLERDRGNSPRSRNADDASPADLVGGWAVAGLQVRTSESTLTRGTSARAPRSPIHGRGSAASRLGRAASLWSAPCRRGLVTVSDRRVVL